MVPSAWPNSGVPLRNFSGDPQADLYAYAGTYLQQEIMAEGASLRAFEPIRRFNAATFKNRLKAGTTCRSAADPAENRTSRPAVSRDPTMQRMVGIRADGVVNYHV